MKKRLLLFSILLGYQTSFSQTIFTPEITAKYSSFSERDIKGEKESFTPRPGLRIGIYADNIPFCKGILSQDGLFLVLRGAERDDQKNGYSIKEKLQLLYVEDNVNFIFNLFKNDNGILFVAAGPFLRFGIYAQSEETINGARQVYTTSQIFGSEGRYRNFDYGFNLGMGYALSNGLYAKLEYGQALANIGHNAKAKNIEGFGCSIGCKINMGKM